MARKYRILIVAALIAFGSVAWGFAAGAGLEDQWRLASRYTARVGFPILILTYLASSLYRLFPGDWTRALLQDRRQWGLAFALAHTVHLVALGVFNILILNMPSAQTLIGGGGAYGIMYLMALTSNRWGMQTLGKHWKTLHRVGIHWLWFIFTFSYFGRLFDPERAAIGYVFFPICIVALGIRIWAWQTKRTRKESLSPA